MTQSVTYTQRLHAFKKTRSWTVQREGIAWEDQDDVGATGFIPFESITSVRLRFEPTRAERRRIALHIYTPIDYPITNINYHGPLNFELQKEEFMAFVEAFHDLFPRGSKTVFHKGSTMAGFIGNILMTAALFVMLFFAAPLISATGMPSGTSILRLLIILILLPVLAKVILKNKPQTYRPESWPKNMLE